MRFLRKLIRAGLILGMLALGALIWVGRGLFVPADPSGAERSFVIKAGEPLGQVVRRLDREGLLTTRTGFGPRILVAYARLRGVDRDVKAGEYALSPALSPTEILDKIRSGDVSTFALTLPEGLNVWEVAKRIEENGIAPASAVVELARSKKFTKELGVEADSLEGYLYPETYRFERGTDPAAALRTMVQEFQARWTDRDRQLLASSGRTLHQVVSLASVVEKETGAAAERPRIARVFVNRLTRGMRLQSDPTVIYGIMVASGGAFSGNLRRADLERDHPYNTYRRSGIPPGPIASVSIESVRAVLEPEKGDFLYFVSRNDGTHQFSSTLAEHNRAVTRYQRKGASPAVRVIRGYSAEAKRPGGG
jgi:UPF0755 protein